MEAAQEGGTLPCVLNAANEVCVERFMEGTLGFIDIPRMVGKVMDRHNNIARPGLEEILAADRWAREQAAEIAGRRR